MCNFIYCALCKHPYFLQQSTISAQLLLDIWPSSLHTSYLYLNTSSIYLFFLHPWTTNYQIYQFLSSRSNHRTTSNYKTQQRRFSCFIVWPTWCMSRSSIFICCLAKKFHRNYTVLVVLTTDILLIRSFKVFVFFSNHKN